VGGDGSGTAGWDQIAAGLTGERFDGRQVDTLGRGAEPEGDLLPAPTPLAQIVAERRAEMKRAQVRRAK
jgi:hypothetical protein